MLMDSETSKLAGLELDTVWLYALPSELVELVLFFLDCDPPSTCKRPSGPASEFTSCADQPLKSLSLVSQAWRGLTLRHLFKHTRLHIKGVYGNKLAFIHAAIGNLHHFIRFLENKSLGPHVESFVLISEQDCERYEDSLSRARELGPFFWPLIFTHINPRDVFVCSPPETLGCLTGLSPFLYDAWAFEIPFQLLHLQQSQPERPQLKISEPSQGSSNRHCLLSTRPWTYLGLNEGSFARSYSAYEYWLLRPPSLLEDARLSSKDNLACLTRFSFTAFFPQRSHVGNMLVFVRSLKLLETLRVQLMPSDGSLTPDGEEMVKLGKVDSNDLWREVGESYTSILRAVSSQSEEEGRLMWFESGDWVKASDGGQEHQRMTVTNKISEELPGWLMVGNGCWKSRCQILAFTRNQ